MRGWMLLLAGVVAISVILWVRRPAEPTVGAKLLVRLVQADNGTRMRGAIELIDFAPDLKLVSSPQWQHGEGSAPGSTVLNQLDTSNYAFWIKGPEFLFSWNRPSAANPLRAALANGSDVRNRIQTAMPQYDAATVKKTIDQAALELAALSDEALFTAWLRSDRVVLAESQDLVKAVREALLLEARYVGDPIVTFKLASGARVYLLPMPSRSARVWLDVGIFDTSGKQAISGVLSVDEAGPSKAPNPEDVRRIAAVVSTMAFNMPPATSTAPGVAQLLH